MIEPRLARRLTSWSLVAAAAIPVIYIVTQIAAAQFYPGYSYSLQSVSMLGTRFSQHPWIFNIGVILTGLSAIAAVFGMFRVFCAKTHFLLSLLIAFSVACIGVMYLKAGMFPLPDPRHNSWDFLQKPIVFIPHLMLIGLWKRNRGWGLRIYLIFCITLLLILGPFTSSLGRGTVQRLIHGATVMPVGVIGLFFWRELQRGEAPKATPRETSDGTPLAGHL